MIKLLVGLVIDCYDKNESVSVIVNVPETYEPILDSPDDMNPFPILRGIISNDIKHREYIPVNEHYMYDRDNIIVTCITVLGYVDVDNNVVLGMVSVRAKAELCGHKCSCKCHEGEQ